MVIGWPSPAACSPLLVSRSTGPQPLVADRNGRSLTASGPGGGGGGTDRMIRSSEFIAGRSLWLWFTAAAMAEAAGSWSEAAWTCQVNVAFFFNDTATT